MKTVDVTAWIETKDGAKIPLEGLCTIGRAPGCQVVVDSNKASRRHAVIRPIGLDGLEITDLGSSNGTYVNQRRVPHQQALHDGDIIELAAPRSPCARRFCPPRMRKAAPAPGAVVTEGWLLLASAAGGPRVSSNLDERALKTEEGWELDCTRSLEAHRGTRAAHPLCDLIWHWDAAKTPGPAPVRRALIDLDRIRLRQRPHLSVALHYGPLVADAHRRTDGRSVTGLAVAFAIQLLKQAPVLEARCLVSEEARAHFDQPGLLRDLGPHFVPGFPGNHRLFSL